MQTLGVIHPTLPAIGDFAFAGTAVAVERGTLWMSAPYADLIGDASGARLRYDGDARIGEATCVGRRNSSLAVASLAVRGSDLASDQLLGLDAVDLPGATTTLLVASAERGQAPALGGGAGDLCLSGTLVRILATAGFSSQRGVPVLDLDFATLPHSLATVSGSTLCFQLWCRDIDPTQTSNTTDAIEVLLR